ncbi:MAG: hypothetical protein LBR41_00860, partial [Rickettsiales bacterium]|nr:hypothetical protein [Rickettsiales bacterium]
EEIVRDAAGRLIPGELPTGIFVAGDVQSGLVMQVATAVGAGCDAGIRAIAYVNKLGNPSLAEGSQSAKRDAGEG